MANMENVQLPRRYSHGLIPNDGLEYMCYSLHRRYFFRTIVLDASEYCNLKKGDLACLPESEKKHVSFTYSERRRKARTSPLVSKASQSAVPIGRRPIDWHFHSPTPSVRILHNTKTIF
jgi:hypothetical protein